MAGIKDVSKKAGVSISTVSNVINGTKYVSSELRQKVLRTIEELNYEADPAARSLKSNKTMTLGIVITNIGRIFFPQVIRGIQEEAERNGFSITFCNTDDKMDKEHRFVKMLENSRVDGIILDSVASMEDGKYFRKLSKLGNDKKHIPVVSMERALESYGIDSIVVDNKLGGKLAAEHLLECGCKKLAFVSGPSGSCMSRDRCTGFSEGLSSHGISLPDFRIVQGDFSPLSGYKALKTLLSNGEIPDGIFAANDQMAIGAIKALREFGLRIPEDVKVMGFDNTFVASILDTSLTTIHVPKYKMGCAAVEALIRRMSIPEEPAVCIELPIQLIVRRSTDLRGETGWDLMGW